ncbi:MFS transporter [Paenibacillus eucommiae]|uniref:MFS family permease/acetolactate synthase regulatory subunit n=1 Tax=Paenibacillus eucommiae TaxID=1355755 RepID=A0ABS4INP9_9BACL|nr:MFS transporter [Paenibacillus eucommiae]MBP1989187.1 MFS family permease/acetolactate synthase regulatory subunit [Paenibacillus eucommiae]
MITLQRLTMTVHNQPGALARVTELFSRNGYNIDRIHAGMVGSPAISRMRIDTSIGEEHLQRIMSQLTALADVIQVVSTQRKRISLTGIQFRAQTSFWFIAFSLFIAILGANLPTPLYALYRMKWNLSPVIMTLLFASYALVVIPTIVIVGQISDRWGRKSLLVPAVFCSFTASFLFMFAEGIGELLAARVLQGLSVGMFSGIAVSALMAFLPREKLGKAAVVLAIATTSANAAAPLVGGGLGQYAPAPLVLSFAIHAALALLCLFGIAFFVPETHNPSLLKSPLLKLQVPKEMRGIFFHCSTATFLAWTILGLLLSVIPSYMNDIVGRSNLLLSGGMVSLVLGMSALSQLLLRKLPTRRAAQIGCIAMLLGLAAVVAMLVTKSLILLVLMSCLIGIGHGPLYSGSLLVLNAHTPDRSRTSVMSLFYAVSYMGLSIPILGLGFVARGVGLTPAIYGFAAVMVVLIVVHLVRGERKR